MRPASGPSMTRAGTWKEMRKVNPGKTLAYFAAALMGSAALAEPTLSLMTAHSDEPLHEGDLFEVVVSMSDLGDHEAAGFIAFVAFDEAEVEFAEGIYTDWPFGLHLIDPIVANGEVVALAARIDEDAGQTPTSEDADLAILTFRSKTDGCVRGIGFDDSPPGNELTDEHGDPITPLALLDLPPLPAPRLALDIDYGEIPIEPGDFVVLTVSMTICDDREAVGFQAFLDFDQSEFEFVHGTYTDEPFGRPIISPIAADGSTIDLSAGIDVEHGQESTSDPAVLANLTFMSVSGGCRNSVWFREHDPPCRIADPFGEPITPLSLDELPEMPCPADIILDCEVNVVDLLDLLARWGEEGGPADIIPDGIVNVADLLFLLSEWGPCL
jgi:hypothetical protein